MMVFRLHIIFSLAFCMVFIGQDLHAQWRTKSGKDTSDATFLSEASRKEKCWSGNCFDGQGQYYFSGQKALYQGQFKNGLPNGKGEAQYDNGEVFDGEWVEGYFHGYGQLTLSDGAAISGRWVKGVFMEQGSNEVNGFDHGKIYAIIVGISHYPHMPSLKFADDDAYQFYAHLRSPEGGAMPKDQIELLIDDRATKENIQSAFENVFSQAGEKDMVFVYFSGHGLDDALLPYDFDGTRRKVYYKEIEDVLEKSRAGCKFFALDACHSGNAFREKSLLKNFTSFADWTEGTVYLMSSEEEETSLESDGLRQGVFSHFLLKGLLGRGDSNADGVVTIQELYRYVNQQVIEYTGGRQHPKMHGNYNPSSPIAFIK